MSESVTSRLEVSVSFGKFDNDALSWEKWSSFSPNKYLEEVGSLSTTGSVAQKKAYFEAHYKKIAARKAELLELEDSRDPISPSQDEPIIKDQRDDSSTCDESSKMCNGENVVPTNDTIVDERSDGAESTEVFEQAASANSVMDVSTLEAETIDNSTAIEVQNPIILETVKEDSIAVYGAALHAYDDAVEFGEHVLQKDTEWFSEHIPETENKAELLTDLKQGNSMLKNIKLNSQNKTQKVTPTKTERSFSGVKKKGVSPPVKPSQASTPKSSFVSASSSKSLSGKVKMNESSVPKSENELVAESKRAIPTSLHMSLSWGPTNSSAAFAMSRKSLIMEKMGDKDIIKRAFKSFHNQINEYPADGKPTSVLKQASSAVPKTKISASFTPIKENKGQIKVTEKVVTPRNKLGNEFNLYSSSSRKRCGIVRKTSAASPSIGFKSDGKAEKRKEFVRNIEAKSISREADKIQLVSKSKEEKESEIRKLRQTLNFKATPLPSFYRSPGKGLSEKQELPGNKTTHHHQSATSKR